jgi:predicted DNA-binding transcriptional regulator AlpA
MGAATYNVDQLAELTGCSTWLLYKLVRENASPYPVIKLGPKRIVFPKAPVDKLLGLDAEGDPT